MFDVTQTGVDRAGTEAGTEAFGTNLQGHEEGADQEETHNGHRDQKAGESASGARGCDGHLSYAARGDRSCRDDTGKI